MKKIDFTLKNEMKNNFFGRKDLCVLVAARKIDITFLGLLNWNAKKNEILMRSFASPSSTFAIIIRPVGTRGRGSVTPPDFGRSVYPIPTRWADYAHNITKVEKIKESSLDSIPSPSPSVTNSNYWRESYLW